MPHGSIIACKRSGWIKIKAVTTADLARHLIYDATNIVFDVMSGFSYVVGKIEI